MVPFSSFFFQPPRSQLIAEDCVVIPDVCHLSFNATEIFPLFYWACVKFQQNKKLPCILSWRKLSANINLCGDKKNRRALEGTKLSKLYSVSHPSIKLFIKGFVHCPSRWQSWPSENYRIFSAKLSFFFFFSCRRPASWKWGQFFHTLLFFNSLLTLTVAKCSSRQLGVFLFRFN